MFDSKVTVAVLAVAALSGCSSSEAPADEMAAAEVVASIGAAVDVPAGAQAVSFLGEVLMKGELSEAALEIYNARYEEAERALANTPENVDSLIWMGRRTAYLNEYRQAIEIYTHAMTLHPTDARLYRHRGHRYISVREIDNAIADFERAAELFAGQPDVVEPDGLPNARGIPTSSLQFNTWYHLGLARWIKGDFAGALEAYEACAAVSTNPDAMVATAYWHYMTLVRLDRTDEAQALLDGIPEELDIIENASYHDMLLLFKGERTVEDVTGVEGDATPSSMAAAYGVAMYYLLNGDQTEAFRRFEEIREGMNQWASFGFVGAEAELARSDNGA